jgi:prepilin-type N-terminal cleavage/methylation domain-containing protein
MIIIDKMRNYFKSLANNKGFTLIELLVVIGILGVLAATLLVTLDPLEQFARGRDSGRLTTVDSLGHAVAAYFTSTAAGTYPVLAAATWQTSLVNSGDLKIVAINSAYTSNGATNGCAASQGGFCYAVNGTGTDAIIYTRGESKADCQKASVGANPCVQNNTWVVWDTMDGRTGLYYNAAAPTAGTAYGAALH